MATLRRKRYYVVYPEYFNKSTSRKAGRRMPLTKATEDSSLAKLKHACLKLSLDFEIENDKAYPNNWWEKSGRVLIKIDKNDKKPKQILLNEIGEITRRLVSKKKETKVVRADSSSKYKRKSTHSRKKSAYKMGKKKKDSDENISKKDSSDKRKKGKSNE